jgi:hypothetical protein
LASFPTVFPKVLTPKKLRSFLTCTIGDSNE